MIAPGTFVLAMILIVGPVLVGIVGAVLADRADDEDDRWWDDAVARLHREEQ